MRCAFFVLLLLLSFITAPATTLPPELKAYDFAQAYYVEDGGVVIAPYDHGFYCPRGIQTPEGIRVMPGDTFVQFNPNWLHEEVYHFVRLNAAQTQAFFTERIYHYKMVTDAHGKPYPQRQQLLSTDDLYLTRFRGMEPFDYVFSDIELHPGEQEWRVYKN